MRVWRRLTRITLICLTLSSLSAAATPDQAAAELALGPQWKHLAQRAGMIFAGTVLRTSPRRAQTTTLSGAPSRLRVDGDFVEFQLRIDRPIAGVEPGQILTIREWSGASSRQPALRPGERVLLFLYPPSRLGLTSPVGGAQGQIRLDSTGQSVAESAVLGLGLPARPKAEGDPDRNSQHTRRAFGVPEPIPVSQLERAIRNARGERP